MKAIPAIVARAAFIAAIATLASTLNAAEIDAAAGAGKEEPLYKTTYRVIDIHAHAPFPSETQVRTHLEILDRVGVQAFNVLLYEPSGWPYKGGWSERNLIAWLELRKAFPDRLHVFGTVDFRRVAKEPEFFTDIVAELEREARRGMQGVKIWKNLGMLYRDAGWHAATDR